MEQSIKDVCREGIIIKSIQILRTHGKNDKEIKEMMLKDFSIKEDSLEVLMKSMKA